MRVIAVLLAEDDSEVQESLDEYNARRADAWWTFEVRKPFTWQRFTNWWVARRWIVPRDVRKR